MNIFEGIFAVLIFLIPLCYIIVDTAYSGKMRDITVTEKWKSDYESYAPPTYKRGSVSHCNVTVMQSGSRRTLHCEEYIYKKLKIGKSYKALIKLGWIERIKKP